MSESVCDLCFFSMSLLSFAWKIFGASLENLWETMHRSLHAFARRRLEIFEVLDGKYKDFRWKFIDFGGRLENFPNAYFFFILMSEKVGSGSD